MTASPPQIKTYLEEIKTEFLDNNEKQFADYIVCLICLEILQRGVIVSANISDPSKILDAARNAAGKALLDSHSPIPKPVLAGSAVIAGRIAESAVKSYRSSSLKDIGLPKKDLDAAILRCKDVEDKRLQGILQVMLYHPVSDSDRKPLQFLLVIAEGYYYRAASFQPDAPPMWKKAWDVVVERRKTESRADIMQNPEAPWEAVVPLENLCRIASSKGNEARVAELSLVLAESALDVSDAPESNDSLGKSLREQFILPFRSILPYDRPEAIKIASNALKKAPAQNSPVENLVLSVLDLRLQMDQEDNEIAEMATMLQTKAVNRGDKVVSAEKIHLIAQHKVLAGIVSDDTILAKATKVRDTICEMLVQSEKDKSSVHHFQQACKLVGGKLCDRLTIRAKSVALSMKNSVEVMARAWQEILSFVVPVLSSLQVQSKWSHTAEEKDRIATVRLFLDSIGSEYKSMLENIACLCPLAEWMSQGMLLEDQVDSETQFDRVTLVLVRDILAILHAEAATSDSIDKGESVVSSSMGINQRRLKKLEVNLACCTNLLALSGNYLGETSRSLAGQAIARLSRLSDDDSTVEADGSGLFCLDFFVCWWGLQRMPWSFCTLPESRIILKRARWAFNVLHEKWGRPMTMLERCLLDLGEADAEGIYFSGGLPVIAKSGYQRVLSEAEQLPNDTVKQLLVAESKAGLAAVRFMQSSRVLLENAERIEGFVQDALHLSMKLLKGGHSRKLYLWTDENTVRASLAFQIAALRQFLANILINNGDETAAAQLLGEAVQDAPADASAASALGTYRLRMMLFGKGSSPVDTKAAHVQLMKAARLDSSRAEPFALLGYWYERMGDKQRAVGCYSKATLLEPSQPVAGRGLLRLAKAETLVSSIEQAINSGSPLSGWAWRVTAAQKAQSEGRDDLAILAYLNCLRCRDVDRPQQEPHGMFYSDPADPCYSTADEKSVILGELATCYRRLGRFTAAIRTFHVAIKEGGDNVLSSIFCGCGQAELELGLYDEANANFKKAAQVADVKELPWAMYGQGVSFLALAQRDFHQEKIGSSFHMLTQGIKACDTPFQQLMIAFSKLLGDIYTFGAFLPSDVFVDCNDEKNNELDCKLAFVAKGETAYSQAVQTSSDWEGEDKRMLAASLVGDLAINKLLRAQILASTGYKTDEGRKLFEEAAEGFRRAIDIHPQYPAAWCGLGASVFKSDPLLAQHAFCRSIDLDSQFQDAYANLSFLYTEYNAFSESAIISDALTQIADTPMMWINRALMLEREAASDPHNPKAELQIGQAADAYMASLQVERNPTAILGAAVTKRASTSSEENKRVDKQLDSLSFSTEYSRGRRSDDAWASLLHQLLLLEVEGFQKCEEKDHSLERISQKIYASISKLRLEETLPEDFVQSVESFLRQPQQVEKTTLKHHPDQTKLSAARKIVHDPTKGEAWLALAKELVSQSFGEKKLENHQAALTSSTRAVYILRGQLARSANVQAEDISEALSLNYWLKHITDDVPASEESSRGSHEALQMSLLMFPDNLLAREALKSQSTL